MCSAEISKVLDDFRYSPSALVAHNQDAQLYDGHTIRTTASPSPPALSHKNLFASRVKFVDPNYNFD